MPGLKTVVDNALPPDRPAGREIPRGPEAALFPIEVSYLTGLSVRTLDTVRLTGGGIPYFKLGRAVRYRRGDVDAWLAERVRKDTTDPGTLGRERRSQTQAAGQGQ